MHNICYIFIANDKKKSKILHFDLLLCVKDIIAYEYCCTVADFLAVFKMLFSIGDCIFVVADCMSNERSKRYKTSCRC